MPWHHAGQCVVLAFVQTSNPSREVCQKRACTLLRVTCPLSNDHIKRSYHSQYIARSLKTWLGTFDFGSRDAIRALGPEVKDNEDAPNEDGVVSWRVDSVYAHTEPTSQSAPAPQGAPPVCLCLVAITMFPVATPGATVCGDASAVCGDS